MTGPKTRVVVIGGGYAGVMAANRLTQRDDIDVTLINPRAAFVERIRLHQLVAGNDDAVADYSTLLGNDVRLVVDSADRIDPLAQHVDGRADGQASLAPVRPRRRSTRRSIGAKTSSSMAMPTTRIRRIEVMTRSICDSSRPTLSSWPRPMPRAGE